MKFFKLILLFFLFLSTTTFAQKVIKHKVKSGESIYSIAKKYKVSESDIYALNPKSKGKLLHLKTILLIPNKNFKLGVNKKNESSKNIEKTNIHIVKAGESLDKISKKYGVSVEKLVALNPNIKPKSIKIGDTIIISAIKKEEVSITLQKETVLEDISNTTSLFSANCEDELGNTIHTVQKGETLNKIARKYKIRLKKLKELNEEVDKYPAEGYQLIVKLGTLERAKLEAQTKTIGEAKQISLKNMSKAEFLIAKSSQHLGTRYRGGGTTSAGFDCSGLMFSTFKNINMTLPRSSGSMAAGAGYRIDRAQAKKGDLIFFTTNGRGSINHVGMITEILDNEIRFIHSSVQTGVIISSTKEPYYAKRFIQINRVLD